MRKQPTESRLVTEARELVKLATQEGVSAEDRDHRLAVASATALVSIADSLDAIAQFGIDVSSAD